MTEIAHLEKLAGSVHATIERFRSKENVSGEGFEDEIDEYDYLKEEVPTNIDHPWEQICKTEKAEKIPRLVDVITRAIKK